MVMKQNIEHTRQYNIRPPVNTDVMISRNGALLLNRLVPGVH